MPPFHCAFQLAIFGLPSSHFVNPCHLDRFEDLFAGMIRIVVEIRQFHHPVMQVGKADGARVDFGVGLGEFDGMSRESVHFISMSFLDHIDGVFGNFDHQVAAANARLAG